MVVERDLELAWAAGIVDGEGCIILQYHKQRDIYHLTLIVGNTNWAMLQRLLDIFHCGRIYRKPRIKLAHRPAWTWIVSAKSAAEVLRQIQPYVVAKRQQIEVALASRQYVQRDKNRHPNVQALAWLKKELSDLNHGRIRVEAT